MSPGTTGRRNLQLSMPPKKKFFLAAAFSGSIMTMPPSCAMASTCRTPAHSRQASYRGRGNISIRLPEYCCPNGYYDALSDARPEVVAQRLAWHDFPLWEVSSEEVVIRCDILVADRILLGHILHNTIQQQKWEPASTKMLVAAGNARRPFEYGVSNAWQCII